MRSGWQKSDIEGDEVLVIGGFWCGSCRPQGCGVGVWVTLFTASRSGVLSTRDVHQLKVVVSSEAKLQGCELLMSCFEMWARVRLGGLEGFIIMGLRRYARACCIISSLFDVRLGLFTTAPMYPTRLSRVVEARGRVD